MRFPATVAFLTSVLFSGAAQSQQAVAPIGSVRTELFQSFQTTSASPGQVLYFRSLEPMQATGCILSQNTQFVATVDALHRVPEGPRSLTVAMSFAPISCLGKNGKKVLPLLVAMQNHHEIDNPGHVPLSTAGFQFLVKASMNTTIGPTVNNDVMLATRDAMNAGTGAGSAGKPLMAGQVDGVQGVRLELPAVSPATTLVFSHEQTLPSLETTFYLAFVPVPDASLIDPSDGTETCLASGCSDLLAPTADVGNGNVLWSVPLTPLGFKARPKQQVMEAENEASLHFIGQDQVLLTFPLRTLLNRTSEAAPNVKTRPIRAVLLSRQDGHVLTTTDWQVPVSPGPYVWTFGRDAVLAAVGSELVLFGPNLEAQRSFTLPGPLQFLSAAPSGESILLATVQEKHTPKEHQALLHSLTSGQSPDEDYQLTALDPHLAPTAKRLLHNAMAQPAVVGGAVISAQLVRAGVWRISRTSGSAPNSALATVKSSCAVHVSALRGNLILTQGCVPDHPQDSWYRVLNEKGATLLKGSNGRLSPLLQADTDAGGDHFGLATLQLEPSAKGISVTHGKDSLEEALSVYRSYTGELEFATKVSAGAAEQNHFAMSPGGDVLTIMTRDQVQTFQLPSLKQ